MRDTVVAELAPPPFRKKVSAHSLWRYEKAKIEQLRVYPSAPSREGLATSDTHRLFGMKRNEVILC